MVLYKYYGYESGLIALKSGMLGFRQPQEFNDPFEFTSISNSSDIDAISKCLISIKKSVDVLSLTRQPLNPLMWAHYGNDHTGFVIGYDVDDDFFNSSDFNLIPVAEGAIRYTNTKNFNSYSEDDLHAIYLYCLGSSKVLSHKQRAISNDIFLTKHSSWFYEEEIRVVKMNDNLFMSSEEFQTSPYFSYYTPAKKIAPFASQAICTGLKIYNFKPKIREVYLGLRNPILTAIKKTNLDSSLVDKAQEGNWSIYSLEMNSRSWNLQVSPFDISNMLIPQLKNDYSIVTGEHLKRIQDLCNISELNDSDILITSECFEEIYCQLNGFFLE